MTVHGRIVNASNHTMLVELDADDGGVLAVYKPRDGERPLWDFPFGSLHRREVAAFAVSDYLGWGLVPPTVLRDGPLGPGSVQLFIDHDPRRHYFVLVGEQQHDSQLMRMAVFDLLLNNADRKGSHVLLDAEGHVWGCDHGLTFHTEPKLRTVIWEFGGTALPPSWSEDLVRLAHDVGADMAPMRLRLLDLLDAEEVAALGARAAGMARLASLPDLAEDERPYPWPPV
ncbi:MAG: SCO1664 family protein [Nitriliruptorales bacterium]|nr:SCO1664 family protein [Nitriliruptorales bacterium]